MSRSPTATTIEGAFADDESAPTVTPSVGIQCETIILETREFDLSAEDPAPARVTRRLGLKNLVTATELELALFSEHYLMAREKRKGKRSRSALINLRYLENRPAMSHQVAKTTLLTSSGLLAAALVGVALSLMGVFPLITGLLAVGLAAASSFAFWLYARRTTQTIAFCTAEGRAPALVLRANLGCIGACRALVPSIAKAIDKARHSVQVDRQTYLRRLMREHYRLQEIGVLSADACSTATRRILSSFDTERQRTIAGTSRSELILPKSHLMLDLGAGNHRENPAKLDPVAGTRSVRSVPL